MPEILFIFFQILSYIHYNLFLVSTPNFFASYVELWEKFEAVLNNFSRKIDYEGSEEYLDLWVDNQLTNYCECSRRSGSGKLG